MAPRAIRSAGAVLGLAAAAVWASAAQPEARAQAPAEAQPANEAAARYLGTPIAAQADPGGGAPQAVKLRRRLDELLSEERPYLSAARVGVSVADLGRGRFLYEREPQGRFNVASNAKIITTAAALAELGPDFRFHTALYADTIERNGRIPGDLYIRSTADPYLGTSQLRELVHDLVLAGVTEVGGRIVVDDAYFDGENTPPHFDDYEDPVDEHASYRAPIGAASLNFNMITVAVAPNPSGAGAAVVTIDPPTDYAELRGSVTTVRRGRTRIRVDTRPKDDSLEFVVTGQIRAGEGVHRQRRRVTHPAEYLGGTLGALLAERGIPVEGEGSRRGIVPRDAMTLAVRQSSPLAVMVRGLGKYSNNYVAEMLLKSLGAQALGGSRPATWDDGLAVVRGFLERDVGLAPQSYRYENGSGLFDANEFSPRDIVAVLATAYRDYRYGPELLASLAVAGADGTMRTRLSRDPAAHLVRAKTGTLAEVSALSGYAAVDGRAPVAFSILMDGVPRRGRREARALQDDIAAALVEFLQSR